MVLYHTATVKNVLVMRSNENRPEDGFKVEILVNIFLNPNTLATVLLLVHIFYTWKMYIYFREGS